MAVLRLGTIMSLHVDRSRAIEASALSSFHFVQDPLQSVSPLNQTTTA